jgi:6-pyruvoyltetrahydropterin/6-carboxytetrahydropterin synthase
MKISKTFSFDSAHHLPDYNGKCANVHGHTWQIEVVFEGEINPKTGMILDFGTIKNIVQTNVLNLYDHRDLNTILPNPTAENIAKHTYLLIDKALFLLSTKIKLKEINLWEQPTSKVTYP